MVEQCNPFGDIEGMMVRDRDDSGAEPDAPGALGRGGEEHLGRAHQFPSDGVVFSDPQLVETQLVEDFSQLQIAFKLERGMLRGGMKRRQENAEAKSLSHTGKLPKSEVSARAPAYSSVDSSRPGFGTELRSG